mgnify:CR=1 FL=1
MLVYVNLSDQFSKNEIKQKLDMKNDNDNIYKAEENKDNGKISLSFYDVDPDIKVE